MNSKKMSPNKKSPSIEVARTETASIAVERLSKRFRRARSDRPSTLKEWLLRGRRPLKADDAFWGLSDVSFQVAPGKMVGLVGHNGAGKSTLLRLVGGVGRAERGRVSVNGRVGALLDLGAGFHPDLSGRENVFIVGVIAGLTRREVARRFEAIVAFAELEAFIDSPLRTYSSGMQMRLAFAVAAHTEPQILLIDEVLAVGDLAFQHKCIERIVEFQKAGCTIMLVSHDLPLVRRLCDEVIWLRSGQVVAHGPAEVVVDQYVAEMSEQTRRRTLNVASEPAHGQGALRLNHNRFGSLEAEITAVRLLNAHGLEVREIGSGDPLRIELDYFAPEPLDSPIFGVTVSNADGLACYDASTAAAGVAVPKIAGRGRVTLAFERIDLVGGAFYVDVGIYAREWAYAYDYHWHVYPLSVRNPRGDKGVVRSPHRWSLEAALEYAER